MIRKILKLIRDWKRPLFTIFITAGLFFLIGFSTKYHIPKIKKWILVEVEAYSQKNLPVRIWPRAMRLNVFPPGVTFERIYVLPKKTIKPLLEPMIIERATISLSVWGLMKGQLRIGNLEFDDTLVQFHIPNSEGKNTNQLPFLLESIYQLPIDKVTLKNISIQSTIAPMKSNIEIKEFNLMAINRYRAIEIQLASRGIQIHRTGPTPPITGDFDTQFLIDNEGIYFSNIAIHKGNSILSGTGALIGKIPKLQINEVRGKIKSEIDLNNLDSTIAELFPDAHVPRLAGSINLESNFISNLKDKHQTNFIFSGQNLAINQYRIGNAVFSGKTIEKVLKLSKGQIRGGYGELNIENAQTEIVEPYKFSGSLKGNNLKISEFLDHIGIHAVPVYSTINGSLPCSGQALSPLRIKCKGDISASALKVTNGKSKPFTIIETKDATANGEVLIETDKVTYNAKLTLGDAKGESSGVINYKTGFRIEYSTPEMNLKNIPDLAGLRAEGVVALNGNTIGDSHAATIDMKIDGKNMRLFNFGLGDGQFQFDYKKKLMHFNNLTAVYGQSRYAGKLVVDLNTDTLKADIKSPFVTGEDLLDIFKDKVKLPFAVTGTGSFDLDVSGPFDFSLLSYVLKSKLFRGTIANESYDQVNFDVTSKNGYVQADQVFLTKGRSRIDLYGKVKPTSEMNIELQGRNFRIEQSENLSAMKLNINGNVDFDMFLKERILAPHINMSAQIKNVTVNDIPAKNSEITVALNPKEVSGHAEFLGDVLNMDFVWPFTKTGNAIFSAKTNKWNFAQFFTLFSDSLKNGNYLTSVTGEAKVSMPIQDIYGAEGEVKIDEVLLRSGRAEMKSTKPIRMTLAGGILQVSGAELIGENTFLTLKSHSTKPRELGLKLDGRVDLVLASLITPFFDDIRGIGSFALQLDGPFRSPKFIGSSYIKDGFIKIKNFIHPLEQLQGDTIFNQEKIIINAVRGRIAGGPFQASGQVEIRGLDNIPVDVHGEFTDSKFAIPEGFTTRGSGEFFIKGNWFPYLIGVNFNVDSGGIDRSIGGVSSGNEKEIKPSAYLPKFLTIKRFSPINLQIDVNIQKPLPVKLLITRIDIRSEVTGRMRVTGPPDNPLLTGKIQIARGGKVYFRTNVFEIKGGTVEYKESAPDNPILNVMADARVTAQLPTNGSDIRTRDYDISLRVQGEAKNPKITITSEPQLPENEVISLLTLGVISESFDKSKDVTDTSGSITNTSYQLGSAFLNEQLGINKTLESRLGVQFDFSSSYEEQAAVHKFTFKKQWSPKFGTSASRSIGKKNVNNVKAEYKINKNVSVIGQWEGNESKTSTNVSDQEQTDIFGLDLEYRLEFK